MSSTVRASVRPCVLKPSPAQLPCLGPHQPLTGEPKAHRPGLTGEPWRALASLGEPLASVGEPKAHGEPWRAFLEIRDPNPRAFRPGIPLRCLTASRLLVPRSHSGRIPARCASVRPGTRSSSRRSQGGGYTIGWCTHPPGSPRAARRERGRRRRLARGSVPASCPQAPKPRTYATHAAHAPMPCMHAVHACMPCMGRRDARRRTAAPPAGSQAPSRPWFTGAVAVARPGDLGPLFPKRLAKARRELWARRRSPKARQGSPRLAKARR
eukprot:gene12167-biopygen6441